MANVSKKILVGGLVIVGMLAVYISFFKNDGAQSAIPNEAVNGPVAGPYLTGLADLEGKPEVMDPDKLIFLNVWATWCGPCNMEMPGIQNLYEKYKDHQKVAFYIVSDEDAATVNPFIARKGYNLPFYQYVGAYPSALDGNAIPRTYIIHKGEILVQETGASQWDRPDIIELIDKKLAEI